MDVLIFPILFSTDHVLAQAKQMPFKVFVGTTSLELWDQSLIGQGVFVFGFLLDCFT